LSGARRSAVPIWAMGLSNALFGMYGGILVICVPQLLSARHVPEATIASMTAVMISPGFWTFLLSPVLDVKFSRRWYSVMTALIAAALLSVALLNLERPVCVEALLVVGFFFANLYQNALGGWLSSIIANGEERILSVWSTIGNISGGGLMAIITGEVVTRLSSGAAATVLGLAVLVPIAIFPWMDAPGPDRRLARESFGRFFAEVAAISRRREVLIAIVLFLAPAATFSLTNLLGGLGADFHASTHFVGLVGGAGVLLGGVAGYCPCVICTWPSASSGRCSRSA
jgi:PAT family beta-lactamase induction signal transducer AmpG